MADAGTIKPILPDKTDEIAGTAMALHREAAMLSGLWHPATRMQLKGLVRYVNCYYSNLIEDQHIHPEYVAKAFQGIYENDPYKRKMQLLSRGCLKIQQFLEKRLEDEPDKNISSEDFLRWIHAGLFQRVPREFRETVDAESGELISVIPGEMRSDNEAATENRLWMQQFLHSYDPSGLRDIDRIIGLAASHYHLAGLQPFQVGNGRVLRYFSDAYAMRAEISADGLWSLSRGIARNRDEYRRFFKPAEGDRNGKQLHDFCLFFLELCLGQVRFMKDILDADQLLRRVHKYVSVRAVETSGRPELRSEARYLLETVLLRGSIARGEAPRITGLGERTARTLVSSLLEEGLLESENHKAPLRAGFPTHVVGWWFSHLYPEGMI